VTRSGSTGVHSGVAAAVPDGDEELDDVQESSAMMTVCGAGVLASYNDKKWRLELSAAAVRSRAWQNTSHTERDQGV
jgi:hypothetical protein